MLTIKTNSAIIQKMEPRYAELRRRLDSILFKLFDVEISNPKVKRDLRTMCINAEIALTAANKEYVNCSRRKKIGQKYLELLDQAQEVIDLLDQYLTLACLQSPVDTKSNWC